MPSQRASRARFALAAACGLLLAILTATGAVPVRGAAATTPRPNVVVVLTDDQTIGELSAQTMPKTLKALGKGGTTFTNSVVTSPLCCPSRAGFLTGDYPHNSGVYDNEPGYSSLIDKSSILYSWLQNAGYRTGHIGRFLLNYDRAAPAGMDYDTNGGLANPGGLDDWYGYVGAETRYYGATFSDNGVARVAGPGRAGYTTRVINREALDFVRAAKRDPRPFFLMVAHVAPHASNSIEPGGCVQGVPHPEPGALRQFRNEPLPKPPNFDENPIADKPYWVRTRPALGHTRRRDLKLGYRCALASLPTVDRGVAHLVKQLRRQDDLDNTAIFFTSDNGYFFGEHRIVLNKVYPYEEALKVPLLAKLPVDTLSPRARRRGQPAKVATPVSSIDLTATVLDLAGAAPCTPTGDCRIQDGRSLLPLLDGRRPAWTRGRALLFQIGSNRTCGQLPADRGLNTYYDALRTRRYTYVELNRVNPLTGECDRPEYELYDLEKDPYELRNQAVNPAITAPSAIQAGLAARLASAERCSGIAGRDPAGTRPFCE